MIYLEPTTLGWRPIMRSWINALPRVLTKEGGEIIECTFEWLLDPCLNFVRKNCKVRYTGGQGQTFRSGILVSQLCDSPHHATLSHITFNMARN